MQPPLCLPPVGCPCLPVAALPGLGLGSCHSPTLAHSRPCHCAGSSVAIPCLHTEAGGTGTRSVLLCGCWGLALSPGQPLAGERSLVRICGVVERPPVHVQYRVLNECQRPIVSTPVSLARCLSNQNKRGGFCLLSPSSPRPKPPLGPWVEGELEGDVMPLSYHQMAGEKHAGRAGLSVGGAARGQHRTGPGQLPPHASHRTARQRQGLLASHEHMGRTWNCASASPSCKTKIAKASI